MCAFQEVIEQVKERKIPIVIDAVSTVIAKVRNENLPMQYTENCFSLKN